MLHQTGAESIGQNVRLFARSASRLERVPLRYSIMSLSFAQRAVVTAVSTHFNPSSTLLISVLVIQALVSRTGRLGLEAFLPPPHRIHYSNVKGRVVEDVDPQSIPRLPLVKRPKDTSFAMKDVLREWGTVRVRDWILRAMERYRFVVGESSLFFNLHCCSW